MIAQSNNSAVSYSRDRLVGKDINIALVDSDDQKSRPEPSTLEPPEFYHVECRESVHAGEKEWRCPIALKPPLMVLLIHIRCHNRKAGQFLSFPENLEGSP